MNKMVTVVMTVEQATAVINAIGHYENDSGRDDANLACEIVPQLEKLIK